METVQEHEVAMAPWTVTTRAFTSSSLRCLAVLYAFGQVILRH